MTKKMKKRLVHDVISHSHTLQRSDPLELHCGSLISVLVYVHDTLKVESFKRYKISQMTIVKIKFC